MSSIRRISVILADVFNARNRERLGVNYFLNKGVFVSCIDVSDIVHQSVKRDRSCYDRQDDALEICHVTDLTQLRDLEPTLSGSDLILNYVEAGVLTRLILPIMRLVSQSGRPYLVQYSSPFPGVQRYSENLGQIKDRVFDVCSRVGNIDPVDSVLRRLPPQWLGVTAPAYMVAGGANSTAISCLIDSRTRMIRAHAMDYEIFRLVRDRRLPVTDTVAFIDEFLPFHPDLAAMKLDSPMSTSTYYPALTAMFDRIERELNFEVVIAACPHSDYENRPGLFGDRRVEKHKTANIIAQSKLVVAHRSTAINFAILFRKPLMLTATRSTYRHTSQKPYFDGLSDALNKPIQFFDDAGELELSNVMAVDNEAYDHYINDYIKLDGSPDLPYWDIVWNALDTAPETSSHT